MGISGIGSSGGLPLPQNSIDYQTILQWENELENGYPQGGQSHDLVDAIESELKKYLSGEKGYFTADQVREDINHTFFLPAGNADVYMAWGLGSPEAVESIMGIFGLKPQPPTQMDKTMMHLIGDWHQLPDCTLLGKLLDRILGLGSNGSVKDLQKWATQYKESSIYQDSTPEEQAAFCKYAKIPD